MKIISEECEMKKLFVFLFCIFFLVSCSSFRAGVEGLEKGEIVIERTGNLVSMKINGGV